MANPTTLKTIEDTIAKNNIVLFMKGTKQAPMCGFSARVAQILQSLGVDYKDINVLQDPEIREGIKEYSDWPTIPQLYVKGEFIGGCDITAEMYQSGELKALLEEQKIL
jgi:monothiol glutaredoxin